MWASWISIARTIVCAVTVGTGTPPRTGATSARTSRNSILSRRQWCNARPRFPRGSSCLAHALPLSCDIPTALADAVPMSRRPTGAIPVESIRAESPPPGDLAFAHDAEADTRRREHSIRVAIVAPSLRILGGQAVQAERLLHAWRDDVDVDAWLVPINPMPPRALAFAAKVKYARTVVTQFCYWSLLVRELRHADVVHVF